MWICLNDASLKGGKYYGTVCGYHGNRHLGCEEAEITEECWKRHKWCVCVCSRVCKSFECMKAITVVKRTCCWPHKRQVKRHCLYDPNKNERSSVITHYATLLNITAAPLYVWSCLAAAVWVGVSSNLIAGGSSSFEPCFWALKQPLIPSLRPLRLWSSLRIQMDMKWTLRRQDNLGEWQWPNGIRLIGALYASLFPVSWTMLYFIFLSFAFKRRFMFATARKRKP